MGDKFYKIEFEGAHPDAPGILQPHTMRLWANSEAGAVLALYEFYVVEQIFSIEQET